MRLYTYREITELHIELTSKCQAACPMCGRNINGGRTRENLPLNELRLRDFKRWFPADFVRGLKRAVLCGNYGDPIIAEECLAILSYLRAENPSCNIYLMTNGSARDAAFWAYLARLDVRVHFALDGATAESHQRYRRHTRFNAILRNAETFIEAGGRASWIMLAFAHNEDEVETARNMAADRNFFEFVLKSTNRFLSDEQRVENEQGEKIDALHPSVQFPPVVHTNKPTDNVLASCDIDCKVVRDASAFVTADGHLLPCCWLGSGLIHKPGVPGALETKSTRQLHDLLARLPENAFNMRETPVPVIVNRFFPQFSRRWGRGSERLRKCAEVCGKTGPDLVTSTVLGVTRLEMQE